MDDSSIEVHEDDEEETGGSRRRKLTQGHIVTKLCRELAVGEKSQVQLAEEYDVAQSSISTFKKRHAERIREIQQNLDNEFAGLWIAEKANRIAEYQADVEMIGSTTKADLLRVKATILKAVSEELGQLPARVNVTVTNPVTYIVKGVDVDDLT
jgi:hypothetical protein